MRIATAKLFASGGSQAVRLPAEFRFTGARQVYVRRDETTGDVILSTQALADWGAFMRQRSEIGADVPADFLGSAERGQDRKGEQRDPFEGWKE